MSEHVLMPQFSESLVEGTVTAWLKEPGDQVRAGEDLVVVSTDKIEAEVPAPCDGVLLRIAVSVGETVKVGTVLATLGQPTADERRAFMRVRASADVREVPPMLQSVCMPQLSSVMTEGTVCAWLKHPGEQVRQGEDLFVVSTDKVEAPVPAPCGGVLQSTVVAAGDTVEVGTILAFVGQGAPRTDAPSRRAETPRSAETSAAWTGAVGLPENVSVPQLGESMVEATVTAWFKRAGDLVRKDEDLLAISTDKVEMELPSPRDGVLVRIVAPAGARVRVGALLAVVGPTGRLP